MTDSLKILLLSAYDAASHQRWRQELQQHLPQHRFTQLSLPARYFSWRIRGNSMTWAFGQRELLEQSYDLIIATSMVDLSALRGFIPSLAGIPTLLYFHENQFSYPASEAKFSSVEPQMISLYSALCADALVFNSEFNRVTFFAGVDELLRKLPDCVPAGLSQLLRNRSQVLQVPLKEMPRRLTGASLITKSPQSVPLTIIWNHRWEYDKAPERLLAMLKIFFAEAKLSAAHPQFLFHVVGQQFRQQPSAFAKIKQLLEAESVLGQWGYVEEAEDYQRLLCESHLVLSTALHDFQGLAVLDAVMAGCVPLVPNRQAYPEWFGGDFCYPGSIENEDQEAAAMARALTSRSKEFLQGRLPTAPDISNLSWKCLAPKYAALLHAVSGARPV